MVRASVRNGFDEALAEARRAIAAINAADPSTYSLSLNRVALAIGRILGYFEALLDSGRGGDEEWTRVLDIVATFEHVSGLPGLP